jgi:N-methylhydantoinase B
MRADPITLELVKGALRSAQAEMESLMERTAMSPFINEKKDYFAGFTDGHGRLLYAYNTPMGANMMECILEQYPLETMRPGDLYWYNDCYGSNGGVSHSPDMVFVAPSFHAGQLIGFAEAYGHFWDIGGMRPGSISPDATEIFHEGVIVPPVRIQRAGEWNDEVFRVFVRNSRFPDILKGDIRAMTAAARLGERRIGEMAQRFGSQELLTAFEALMEQTEQALRQMLRATVAEGTYAFSDAVDSDGLTDTPYWVRMALTREGERFVIDTTGSDDQARGAINFVMHETVPTLMVALQYLAQDTTLMLNAGATRIIDEVRVRPGSILRPHFPAPLGSRGHTWLRSNAVVQGLLAQATGGRMPAASCSYCLYLLRAFDRETHQFILCTDGIGVGHGARPAADGLDAVYFVGQKNYPAEYMEMRFPVHMEQYAIHRDSGGPGRYRGGCGVVREVTFLADEGVLGSRMDNVKFPSWGVNGGQAGRPGRVIINPGRPDEREVKPLSDGNRLQHGDVLRVYTSGGGGWGHPFDREPEQVQRDVRGGFVSPGSAFEDYGVVLEPDTLAIDNDATRRRRVEARPAGRMFHRGGYADRLE